MNPRFEQSSQRTTIKRVPLPYIKILSLFKGLYQHSSTKLGKYSTFFTLIKNNQFLS